MCQQCSALKHFLPQNMHIQLDKHAPLQRYLYITSVNLPKQQCQSGGVTGKVFSPQGFQYPPSPKDSSILPSRIPVFSPQGFQYPPPPPSPKDSTISPPPPPQGSSILPSRIPVSPPPWIPVSPPLKDPVFPPQGFQYSPSRIPVYPP